MSSIPTAETSQEFIRLHITPLRPELLNTYLGSTLSALARNISYHSVETFPEKGFGYFELPAMEATKIKKKLNGSILKGQKIRIEDAKPEKRKRSPEVEDEQQDGEEQRSKKTRRSKKSKAGDKVLQGYEIEGDRKVVRGWTESIAEKKSKKEAKSKNNSKDKEKDKDKSAGGREKDKRKKREPSKYTSEPECLFRTSLPETAAEPTEHTEKAEKKRQKDKKKRDRESVVVHEFSNTKKHASFLKSSNPSSDGKVTQKYVDGKGWVDADGQVIEAESAKQKEAQERAARKERRRIEKEQVKKAEQEKLQSQHESEPSSSEPSSPEPSSAEPSSASDDEDEDADEDTTSTPTDPAQKQVHPLEALYKRPKLSSLDTTPKTTPLESKFTFFGGGDDSDIENEDDVGTGNEPQTPFTRQDMEWRGMRSAAPTPDTAAIGRRFSFSALGHVDEDEDDDEDDPEPENEALTEAPHDDDINGLGITNGAGPAEMSNKEESEFAKWFFENRGDNNRKWRARRREAMKMKRKRENRRLTRRIV